MKLFDEKHSTKKKLKAAQTQFVNQISDGLASTLGYLTIHNKIGNIEFDQLTITLTEIATNLLSQNSDLQEVAEQLNAVAINILSDQDKKLGKNGDVKWSLHADAKKLRTLSDKLAATTESLKNMHDEASISDSSSNGSNSPTPSQ